MSYIERETPDLFGSDPNLFGLDISKATSASCFVSAVVQPAWVILLLIVDL